MAATTVRGSVYLGAEPARRLWAAQAVVDEHAVEAASQRCVRRGRIGLRSAGCRLPRNAGWLVGIGYRSSRAAGLVRHAVSRPGLWLMRMSTNV
jgi:hypothetical protein